MERKTGWVSFLVLALLCLCGLQSPGSGFALDQSLPDSVQKKFTQAKTKGAEAHAWFLAASHFQATGQYAKALEAADKSIVLCLESGQTKTLGDAYDLKGIVYDYEGKLAEAIEFYLKGLNIRERLGNGPDIARSLNNLGSGYYYIQSFQKAEDYFSRALAIFEKLNDPRTKAGVYSNLGSVKQQVGKYQESLSLHKKALALYQSMNSELGVALSYSNMGVVFSDLKLFDSSLIVHRKALAIRSQYKDQSSISLSYSNLARLYLDLKKLDSALAFAHKSIALNKVLESREGLRDDYQTMSEIQKTLGNYKAALENYILYRNIADTLVNQESHEKIATYIVQFEFQKQQYSDSLRKSEAKKQEVLRKELADKEIERIKSIQYSGIVIFVMVVLGGVFLIRRVHLPIIWIEGFIFFSAILLFEFLFLFFDPYIDKITGGMPIYKFGTNMIVAIGVFYAHSFFEKLLKERLIPEGHVESNP